MAMIETLESRTLLSATLDVQSASGTHDLAGAYASNFKETFGVTVGVAASSVAATAPGAMGAFAGTLANGGNNR
jgi:hypothetical protein